MRHRRHQRRQRRKRYYTMEGRNPDSSSSSSGTDSKVAIAGGIAIMLLGVVAFFYAQNKANQNAAALNAAQQGVPIA